jgi:hypothetical protein
LTLPRAKVETKFPTPLFILLYSDDHKTDNLGETALIRASPHRPLVGSWHFSKPQIFQKIKNGAAGDTRQLQRKPLASSFKTSRSPLQAPWAWIATMPRPVPGRSHDQEKRFRSL